jgi:hypothetical protein
MPGLKLILRRCRHSRLLAVNLLVTLLALAGIIAYIANAQTTYQITLYPLADARVTSSAADTNYGAEQTTRISWGDRFYIKFNFTATGITQQMPNLRYYIRFYVAARTASVVSYIYATTNDWSEATITWNNKPPENSTTAIASVSISSNGWIQMDITNFVTANCMTKTCSFIITYNAITSPYNSGYYMDVRTKDYSDQNYWPYILIEYQALSTVTQTFTVTSTETVTETQTATETVTTTQTFTVYSTSTITTVTTSYTTVTETTTEVVPATTVTYTSTVATQTETAWTETTQTETVYSTTTRTTTTTIPVTVYQTSTQTTTETVNQTTTSGIESGMVNSILQLFTVMLPIMIIFVVIRSIMGVLR